MTSFDGTVLLVDDDPGILDVLRDRLEPLNLRVYEATCGRETFQLLERHSPDILLLDIAIPDTNGLDILREIRRQGVSVTVIIMTA